MNLLWNQTFNKDHLQVASHEAPIVKKKTSASTTLKFTKAKSSRLQEEMSAEDSSLQVPEEENNDPSTILISFHKVNLTFVIPPSYSTVDDSTISWTGNSEQKIMRRKPKKKKNKLISATHEDAPNTVLIPNKPHPVSTLLNGDCFWMDKSKKPIAVKLVIRHSQNSHFSSSYVGVVTSISIQGIDARVECRQRLWQLESLKIFSSINCQVIMSVRKGYTGSTEALLDAYCTGKGSIAICKPGNVVVSMSAVKEQNGKIINKFLLTNALSSND